MDKIYYVNTETYDKKILYLKSYLMTDLIIVLIFFLYMKLNMVTKRKVDQLHPLLNYGNEANIIEKKMILLSILLHKSKIIIYTVYYNLQI